jgi:PhnB protein
MPEQAGATPEGYPTVAPWVVTDDTGAFLDFVTRAFGGEERGRVPTEDGLISPEMPAGSSLIFNLSRR